MLLAMRLSVVVLPFAVAIKALVALLNVVEPYSCQGIFADRRGLDILIHTSLGTLFVATGFASAAAAVNSRAFRMLLHTLLVAAATRAQRHGNNN